MSTTGPELQLQLITAQAQFVNDPSATNWMLCEAAMVRWQDWSINQQAPITFESAQEFIKRTVNCVPQQVISEFIFDREA